MKKDEAKVDISKISLLHVEIVSFSIKNDINTPVRKSDIKKIDFTFNTELRFNVELKETLIKLKVDVIATHEKSSEIEVGGNFVLDFIYKSENFEDYIRVEDEKNKKLDLTPAFILTLLGLSYSTARGIIFSRSSGTILEGILLPIIAPATLLERKNEA